MNGGVLSFSSRDFRRSIGGQVDNRPSKRVRFNVGTISPSFNTQIFGNSWGSGMFGSDISEETTVAMRKSNRAIQFQVQTLINPHGWEKFWVPGTILFEQRSKKLNKTGVKRYLLTCSLFRYVNPLVVIVLYANAFFSFIVKGIQR